MKKPVLVIMAAGMGSRYGGLKQIDPIDDKGHMIIDFSIYDAVQAGFEKIVFIIKKENEEIFRKKIGDRVKDHIEVEYVYQEIDNVPEGFNIPEGRIKPWGTGHAVLSCIGKISEPFAVINADDFYGRNAFFKIYNFLLNANDSDKYDYAMVGYILENTLTENGHVARGICTTDKEDHLISIKERTHIEKKEDGKIYYLEDDGSTWIPVDKESIVSMNMWGFTASILDELAARFSTFMKTKVEENPLKAEFFLPDVVGGLLREGKAKVKVLKSHDRWYGVTYREDKDMVVRAISRFKKSGMYPEELWTTGR
ncbi:MAG: nucleotidyltransferase [Clostridiaceae bacterium]|nr:nucleotidyltransferase [Clostridiaceae bacterium]